MNYYIATEAAGKLIKTAEVILITAGAGIGVDSGLPDFRGTHGFWKAYPMYERLGMNFMEAANPSHFERDPSFGWGFYGHRLNLYRQTTPHRGFHILLDWINRFKLDYFVVTSNVDGQFQKAGFDGKKIYEIHGSIHYLQCIKPCSFDIWENRENIVVDHSTMRTKNVPKCIHCGAVARPNILMFGDYSWVPDRSNIQSELFEDFVFFNKSNKTVVLEIGAGTSIPSIRHISERTAKTLNGKVIRINPREYEIESPHIYIAQNALVALEDIDKSI